MIQETPDKEAFDRIYNNPYHGALTIRDIVDVFGFPAVELFILNGNYSNEQFEELLECLQLRHSERRS